MLAIFMLVALLQPLWTPRADAFLRPPVSGIVSSRFGWRIHPLAGVGRHHGGVDIAAPLGTLVRPARAGRVAFVGWRAGYGLCVDVAHESGWRTRYAHLSAVAVRTGESVTVTRLLGLVGATGAVTGAHLHFEVAYRQQTLNPLPWLRREPPAIDWTGVTTAVQQLHQAAHNFALLQRR